MSSTDTPPDKKTGVEYTVSNFRIFNSFVDGLISRDRAYTGFRSTELLRLRIKTLILAILGVLAAILLAVFIYKLLTGHSVLPGIASLQPKVVYVPVPDPDSPRVIEKQIIVEVPTYVPIEIPAEEGVVTNFNIFRAVELSHVPGVVEVVTGAKFASSMDTFPQHQYCYGVAAKQISNAQVRIEIASAEGKGMPVRDKMTSQQAGEAGISLAVFSGLFQHCKFFTPGGIVDGGPPAGIPIEEDEDLNISTGTAFAVNDDGYFVTNAHVVQGCSRIGIFKNKLMYPVELHSKDDSMDIAILKADRDLTNSFVRFASETRNGEDVRALGFPEIGALGTSMKITTGNISSMSTPDGDNKYLQFTAPIQGGNSGGPLVNKFNGVVGMVTSTLRGAEYQNVNFAVKGWNIQNYLAANRITFDFSTAKKELDGPTIFETSEKHVRLVFCDLR